MSCQNTSQGPVPVAQEDMPAYIDEVLASSTSATPIRPPTSGPQARRNGPYRAFNLVVSRHRQRGPDRRRVQEPLPADFRRRQSRAPRNHRGRHGRACAERTGLRARLGVCARGRHFRSWTSIPTSPPAGGFTTSTTTITPTARARRSTLGEYGSWDTQLINGMSKRRSWPHGIERRRGAHGVLRAAVRQERPHQLESGPHLLRQ